MPDVPAAMAGANAAFTASWMAGTERKLTVRCTTAAPAATSCRFTCS